MLQRHWGLKNTFEHYGNGDLGMFGYDAIQNPDEIELFKSTQMDEKAMQQQLLVSLTRALDA